MNGVATTCPSTISWRAASRLGFAIVLLWTLCEVRLASAHNGKSHVEGIVASVEKRQLVVKQKNGRSVSLRITNDTTYRDPGTGAKTADSVAVGCEVMVEAFGMPGGEQTALEVLVTGPAPETEERAKQ